MSWFHIRFIKYDFSIRTIAGEAKIQVLNADGRLVAYQTAGVIAGENAILIQKATMLPNGTYTVTVDVDGTRMSQRFIKK